MKCLLCQVIAIRVFAIIDLRKTLFAIIEEKEVIGVIKDFIIDIVIILSLKIHGSCLQLRLLLIIWSTW